MSFHSIDMQQALHRNQDAAQQQREMQQRPIMDQAQLAGQTAKQTKAERHQTAQSAKSKAADNRKREERKRRAEEQAAGQGEAGQDQDEAAQSRRSVPPPSKGRYIDIQL